MGPKPLIIIADSTLAVQAQLGDFLAADLCIASVVNSRQLHDWLQDEPGRQLPDLLLLDASLPDEGIGAFCRAWRNHPRTRHTDIIVMGAADDAGEIDALMAGAVDYLRRPVAPLLCLARVKAQLRQRMLRQQLEAVSMTDSLTGLANRRHLDGVLLAEWRHARRVSGSIGLIMMDIDHFKAYNDFYGHPQGDRCLIRVAQAIRSAVQRPRDLVARYGGEEFLVILPGVQKSGVEVVAARIQEVMTEAALPHSASPVAGQITLSMGLAWCEPAAGENAGLLLEAADEALYAAKAAGRNRISDTVDLALVRHLLPQ